MSCKTETYLCSNTVSYRKIRPTLNLQFQELCSIWNLILGIEGFQELCSIWNLTYNFPKWCNSKNYLKIERRFVFLTACLPISTFASKMQDFDDNFFFRPKITIREDKKRNVQSVRPE